MDKKFMLKAIELAVENVKSGKGGPFGVVIVKNNEIIATGVNQVTATNDVTAHAEIVAARNACKALNDFQLTDCEVYTSCEPCPMCAAAFYWARVKAVYCGARAEDAERVGFDDAYIYEQLVLPYEKRDIKFEELARQEAQAPFNLWAETGNKTEY